MKKKYFDWFGTKGQQGFTLVEVLAVMLIFAIIGGIAAGILVTSLRTSTKSSIITTIKQNGDFAISQIAKTIRNSYILQSPSLPCGDTASPTKTQSITLIDTDGVQTTIACMGSIPGPSNLQNTIVLQRGTNAQESLLDTAQVRIAPGSSSCQFTCSQAKIAGSTYSSDYPVIGISFGLIQKSTSTFSEQIASASAIQFSTTVIFRNYQR